MIKKGQYCSSVSLVLEVSVISASLQDYVKEEIQKEVDVAVNLLQGTESQCFTKMLDYFCIANSTDIK